MREETERLLLSFDPLIIYAAWRKSSPAQRLARAKAAEAAPAEAAGSGEKPAEA